MSHAAGYGEVLFWFLLVLAVLLVTFIGVVVKTPPGTVGSPQPPGLSSPAPSPHYVPRHAGALEPELMVADRLQLSGGPPWEPAPKPPVLAGCDTGPWLAAAGQMPGKAGACRELPSSSYSSPHARPPSGDQAGAHRQARRHGAHRAGVSISREHRSASRTGRHRAEMH